MRCERYEKTDSVITAAGEEEFEVEGDYKPSKKEDVGRTTKIQYLIFWKGYPTYEMTWEPEENVKNAQEKIAEYYRRIEGNASPKEGRM